MIAAVATLRAMKWRRRSVRYGEDVSAECPDVAMAGHARIAASDLDTGRQMRSAWR
ncbi:hypothetical protein [Burkholderia ubonensis]|uniref:hypothetical protein n=1 Tax=Burkholderia ubonensis TaxID=101571 RepID=UPI0012FD5285|nr:hypothetical protein [Burkholderia ubonensis]